KGTTNGFVPAGHCTNGTGQNVRNSSNNVIGVTTTHSTSTDSSFVEMRNGYTMDQFSVSSFGNMLFYSTVNSSYAVVGADVIIYSRNGVHAGTITSLTYYVSYSSGGYTYSVNNTIRINAGIPGGTSGAAAIVMGMFDAHAVVGIAISSNGSGSSISKSSLINSALGITSAP
ncbi:MAG: hypothetical protein GX778_00045, partial [Erysipelothrix sp.]|nr:hypothetical protein [Erysipelothrix sp.]